MAKILWTEQEEQLKEKVLEKFEEYVQYVYEHWDFGFFLTTAGTTGTQALIRIAYGNTNPKLADELLVIARAINIKVIHDSKWGLKKEEIIPFLEKMRIRNLGQYRACAVSRVLPFRISSYTDVMRELLARDFIHPLDADIDDGDYYIEVKFKTLRMLYKRGFSSKTMAKKTFKRVAIYPLCTIKKKRDEDNN